MCDCICRMGKSKSQDIATPKIKEDVGKITGNCVVTKITFINDENLENRRVSKTESIGIPEVKVVDNENEEPINRRSVILVPLPVDAGKEAQPLPNFPKTPDEEAAIKSAIEKNDFLNKRISSELLPKVISAMSVRDLSAGEKIIKEGKEGSEMYISCKGQFQITIKGKVFNKFENCCVFGELAILFNGKRQASIQALTTAKVWVLTREVYQKIVLGSRMKEQDEILRSLENNETLNVIGPHGLREVASLLKQEFFKTGSKIVRQGDQGDKFYIIRAGSVTVTKDKEGVVGKLSKGNCFGELALQKEDSRQATVTADAPGVECLTLTRDKFVEYFGDIRFSEYKPKKEISLDKFEEEYSNLSLKDLKPISALGAGAFGRVDLVKCKNKKYKDMLFALKCEVKANIVKSNRQKYVFNEKDIQINIRSPFIVRLYRTYKDSRFVYFLMEPCLKGDLFALLYKQREKKFAEKEAQFFAACVVECFDYLHSRGIVYRDLKTENLMLDKKGYLKLADFGLSKKIPLRGKTYTFVGTPEYVAPEIFLQNGHDKGVDYWALGVFIYELLSGKTPFYRRDRNQMKIFDMALRGIENVRFPNYISQKARNIVLRLCQYDPIERLGMQLGGVNNIRQHRWYAGFDWSALQQSQMPSPFGNLPDVPRKPVRPVPLPEEELSGWDNNF